jgi:hypothetical protein
LEAIDAPLWEPLEEFDYEVENISSKFIPNVPHEKNITLVPKTNMPNALCRFINFLLSAVNFIMGYNMNNL